MVRIFFKNLFQSILVLLITAVFAGIPLVFLIAILLEFIKMSALTILIICSVTSVIVLGIFYWLAYCNSWEWFFSAEKDYCKHSPHIAVGYLMLVFIFLLFGGTGLFMLIAGFNKIVAAAKLDEDYYLFFLVLPIVILSQLSFLIYKCIYYGKWQICGCGHMFCIDYHYSGSESWVSETYKTKKYQENIGSITADGQKIADVKADRTYGYIEQMHHKTSYYNGNCTHCRSTAAQSKYSIHF